MAALDKLRIVHHPEWAKVVFVAHKALVQWQIGADRILYQHDQHPPRKRKMIIKREYTKQNQKFNRNRSNRTVYFSGGCEVGECDTLIAIDSVSLRSASLD